MDVRTPMGESLCPLVRQDVYSNSGDVKKDINIDESALEE